MKSSTSFPKIFLKLTKNLDSRLEPLLQKADPEAIHDVRTSIRRVEATLGLMPKNIRKKRNFRRYTLACKRLFKSMTTVRDIDIVISNLSDYGSNPSVRNALAKIRSDRDRMLAGILERAESLMKIKVPKLKKNQVSDSKIRKRKRKVIEKMQSILNDEIPVILGDSSKIKELHELRKNCKILRYTLEILPVKREQRIAKLMEEWQKVVGNIRDIDVTEQYVEESNLVEELKEVLMNLNKTRSRLFESFVHSAEANANSPRPMISIAESAA